MNSCSNTEIEVGEGHSVTVATYCIGTIKIEFSDFFEVGAIFISGNHFVKSFFSHFFKGVVVEVEVILEDFIVS